MTPDTRPNSQPALQEEQARHRRNALWISAITAVTLTVITIFVLYTIQREQTSVYEVAYLTGMLAVAAILSLGLSYRGQTGSGIGIMLGGMLVLTFLLPYLAPRQVIAPALASIIMVTTIASATLPAAWALRAGILAAAMGLFAVIADLFTPAGFGIQGPSTGNLPVSAGLVAIYTIIVLRRYGSYNLRTKILVAFVFVAFVPLAILGTYNFISTQRQIQAQGQQSLSELAQTAAAQADTYLQTQLDNLRIEAQQPSIIEFMTLPTFQRQGSAEESNALRTLNTLVRKDSLFIYSYAILDVSGRNILDTVEEQIDRDESREDYFRIPFANGLPYVSTLTFEPGNKTNIHFSAPIRNPSGDVIGVLRAEYNAAVFQALLRSLLQGHQDQSQILALVDNETFVRVAYTGQRELLYKSLQNYGPIDVATLQSQGRLMPGTLDNTIAASADLVRGLQSLDASPFFSMDSAELGGTALTTGAPLTTLRWTAVALQSEQVLFAPIREQSRIVVLASIGLLLLAVVFALIAAQFISAPVLGLTRTAEQLASGDLSARASVSTSDEIGGLANAFNRMSDQLTQTLSGLEARVTERTAEVETARRQSEQRARDLETISDVARIISGEQRLEALLPLIANLVSEKFEHYHTGIFLTDANRQYTILQAASSEGGKRMLARGHRLEVGQTGIVGYVAQTGQPRIALDVGADAAFFNNPFLPETRSEIALPLNVRGQTIGALDVQSTEGGAFSADDINILSILADQVAIAIDNARLFGRTESALAEVQSVYRQYITQEWSGFTRRTGGLGYHQSAGGGSRFETREMEPAARAALESGEVVVIPAEDGTSLAMPVKLRGQVIGFINAQTVRREHEWSADEISLVQAVSDRLALSLENARLFEESTRRADLERISAEIAGRIGSSIQLESILQITAQELSRALGGGTEVLVQVQPMPSDKPRQG